MFSKLGFVFCIHYFSAFSSNSHVAPRIVAEMDIQCASF